MKTLSIAATKTMNALTAPLSFGDETAARKIETSGGTYMAVHVEFIGENFVSVAHYGLQNGDMMRDPDMVFFRVVVNGETRWHAVSYRNDYVGVDQESVIFENGVPSKWSKRQQRDHTTFANQWMKNIREQQGANRILAKAGV